MSDSSLLTVFYTANLGGDLDLLPRLSTLIQRERRAIGGPAVLVDLGDTCSLDAWICRATQGRAPLIVLDAMGYDVALVGGPEQVPIPVASLRQLGGTISMSVVPWNRVTEATKSGITFTLAAGSAPHPEDTPGIRIDRSVATLPDSSEPDLRIGDIAKGYLGCLQIAWPDWTLRAARHVELTDDVPADPTIVAIVDFVTDEARHYAQQQGGIR